MPENEVLDTDARFPVTNTKLAAAAATMGFAVKKIQPCLTEIDGETRKAKTTIWMEPEFSRTDNGETEPMSRYAIAYSDPNSWKANPKNYPEHPFNYCVAYLEAREWLVKTGMAGGFGHKLEPGREYHSTTNLRVAATIFAHKHPLYSYQLKKFFFDPETEALEKDFNSGESSLPVQWMKTCAENYERMIGLIRDSRNIPCVSMRRVANGKERVLLMPVNCPDDVRKTFEHYFYEN